MTLAWSQVQGGDLDTPPEERHNPQPRSYIGSAQQRFRAKSDVIMNDQIFEFKAGAGKKTKMDGTNLDFAANGLTDGLGSFAAQPVGAWPDQEQSQQQQSNHKKDASGKQGLHRTALRVLFQRVSSKK